MPTVSQVLSHNTYALVADLEQIPAAWVQNIVEKSS